MRGGGKSLKGHIKENNSEEGGMEVGRIIEGRGRVSAEEAQRGGLKESEFNMVLV